MAANTSPIFPLTPNLGLANVLLSTAMTNTKAFDGTEAAGTALAQVGVAGASGMRLDTIELRYTSTNGATASGTTNATVIRFWATLSGVNTTATNNLYLGEVFVPAQTVTALGTSVLPVVSFAVAKSLPALAKIYAGATVAVGGTNCAITPSLVAGDY